MCVTETPGHNSGWAETPRTDRGGGDLIQETPTPGASKRRSRWDETPAGGGGVTPSATPSQATPSHATPSHATPSHATPGHTPSHGTPTPHHTPIFTPGGVSDFNFYQFFFVYFITHLINIIQLFFSLLRWESKLWAWQHRLLDISQP